jgi:hypothetical protein
MSGKMDRKIDAETDEWRNVQAESWMHRKINK